MTALPNIEHKLTMNAPLTRAWRVLTDERLVPLWLGCMRYRAEVGATFYMQQDAAKREGDDIEGATHCTVLELDEYRGFRFSWFLPGTPETEVAFTLRKLGDNQTEVTFCHSGWGQFDPDQIRQIHEALSGGWISYVLPALQQVVEESDITGS